jgi:peroxiredoxin
MPELQSGDDAPAFTLLDQSSTPVSLARDKHAAVRRSAHAP